MADGDIWAAVPERVFIDAAKAHIGSLRGLEYVPDLVAKGLSESPNFRAAVESAYRAGYEQALEDVTATEAAIGWTETDGALNG